VVANRRWGKRKVHAHEPNQGSPDFGGRTLVIKAAAASSAGGRPDVVTWLGEPLPDGVLVEYKRPNDRIR